MATFGRAIFYGYYFALFDQIRGCLVNSTGCEAAVCWIELTKQPRGRTAQDGSNMSSEPVLNRAQFQFKTLVLNCKLGPECKRCVFGSKMGFRQSQVLPIPSSPKFASNASCPKSDEVGPMEHRLADGTSAGPSGWMNTSRLEERKSWWVNEDRRAHFYGVRTSRLDEPEERRFGQRCSNGMKVRRSAKKYLPRNEADIFEQAICLQIAWGRNFGVKNEPQSFDRTRAFWNKTPLQLVGGAFWNKMPSQTCLRGSPKGC